MYFLWHITNNQKPYLKYLSSRNKKNLGELWLELSTTQNQSTWEGQVKEQSKGCLWLPFYFPDNNILTFTSHFCYLSILSKIMRRCMDLFIVLSNAFPFVRMKIQIRLRNESEYGRVFSITQYKIWSATFQSFKEDSLVERFVQIQLFSLRLTPKIACLKERFEHKQLIIAAASKGHTNPYSVRLDSFMVRFRIPYHASFIRNSFRRRAWGHNYLLS